MADFQLIKKPVDLIANLVVRLAVSASNMNNFLSIFDNNQQGDDDLMRVSFELTDHLTPVAGHIALSYRGCLLVFAGYYCTENQLSYREPEFL